MGPARLSNSTAGGMIKTIFFTFFLSLNKSKLIEDSISNKDIQTSYKDIIRSESRERLNRKPPIRQFKPFLWNSLKYLGINISIYNQTTPDRPTIATGKSTDRLAIFQCMRHFKFDPKKYGFELMMDLYSLETIEKDHL